MRIPSGDVTSRYEVFGFCEDFSAVVVFACCVLEALLHYGSGLVDVGYDLRYVFLLSLEQHFCQMDIAHGGFDVFVSEYSLNVKWILRAASLHRFLKMKIRINTCLGRR